MPVHTASLFVGVVAPAATWTTVYTTPAGKRTILKELVLQNASGATSDNLLGLWLSGAFVGPVWRDTLQPVTFMRRYEQWTVIPYGYSLRAFSVQGSWYMTLSGTELDIL